ncbi:MAG: hypothetical protein KDC87_06200 [Planctomycetes bacterium]|nr:hypothetical protein [Planctomycetota bacterium]MCB9888881.1 hypothetical protein [Planctomycetota bacterium]
MNHTKPRRRRPTLRKTLLTFATIAMAGTASAQVVIRDKITKLPPSTCQDGATHQAVITGHRLRPGSFDLTKFEGQPVEIQGTPGQVTCPFVTVTAIQALLVDQTTVATKTATTMTAAFSCKGSFFDLISVYVSTRNNSAFFIPGIAGPCHLEPNIAILVGFRAWFGDPYLTVSIPLDPALVGVDFFDQAVLSRKPSPPEWTNVDTFRF